MRTGNERDDRYRTVELSRQAPATADVTVTLDDRPPSEVWRDVFAPGGLREPFVRASRAFATGETVSELYDALDDVGVPAFLATLVRDLATGNDRTAFRVAAAVGRPFDLASGGVGFKDALGIARVFEHVDVSPTVGVRIDPEFFDRRREQRAHICRLIDTLADGADVTVYGSPIELRRLATDHREELAGVSEWCNRDRDSPPVSAALERLGRDGRPVEILRTLADEPGETTTVSALYATAAVSKSRVRQVLSTLSNVGCVETYGSRQNRHVEVTSTGRSFLGETTRQVTLDSVVSESVQSSQEFRVNQGKDGRGEKAGSYRTAYLNRSDTAAAVGCGVEGAVTLVSDGRFAGASDRTRYVSYVEEADDAVVAVRASTPLQYAVSLATALASPEFFDRVLSTDRLDEIEEPAAILRGARCVGGVSKAAEDDPQELRDTLVEGRNDLADMTTALHRGEYDDRDEFGVEIMRSAHGLAGSVIHLLDAVGVSLTREIRVPKQLSRDQLNALGTTLSHSLAIQSKYESFAAYRQLYEDREEKRQNAFSVDVDAADPTGTLVGSVVVRSDAVDRVGEALGDAVRHSLEQVDDAPEFAVSIPVRRGGRQAYRRVAARFGDRKRLSMTDSAVRILDVLTASPYAAAAALNELGAETMTRDIRPDELRYALSTLSADQLTDVPPTARKILSTLLAAEKPLSQAALTDAADVSTSSVRRHIETLTALGIATETDVGYRCSLAFSDETGRDAGTIEAFERATDALGALLESELSADRYADPEDDLAGALHWPPDPWGVFDDPPADLAGWIEVSRSLTGTCKTGKNGEIDREAVATIELGEPTAQQPVTESAEVGA
jgi:predicted transcriptional regulator/biotin operon repressor